MLKFVLDLNDVTFTYALFLVVCGPLNSELGKFSSGVWILRGSPFLTVGKTEEFFSKFFFSSMMSGTVGLQITFQVSFSLIELCDSRSPEKLRDFIRRVYEKKLFTGDTPSSAQQVSLANEHELRIETCGYVKKPYYFS